MSERADLVADQQQLLREVRRLRAQVAAYESSRWWRLHPRLLLRRLRGAQTLADDESAPGVVVPPDFDHADRELCLRVAPHTMTTPARIHALARAVEYATRRRIPGAIVECGVWRGGSMMAVAITLRRLGVTDRDLYLFDTFAGMTEPGPEDVRHTGERAHELLEDAERGSHYRAAAGVDVVRENMAGVGYPEERVHLVQGRVEDTLPERAPDEIALLRLDTDWYASTRHELVHLYPRLARGGVLIVDDYAYWQGARKAVDEYFGSVAEAPLLTRIDFTARLAVKT